VLLREGEEVVVKKWHIVPRGRKGDVTEIAHRKGR
jgi:hypothetical protein